MKTKVIKMKAPRAPTLTKVSSKGQVVIPEDIREQLKISEGSVFVVSALPKSDMVLLKKVETAVLKEDFAMAKKVAEAWGDVEKGRCRTLKTKEFFEELEKW